MTLTSFLEIDKNLLPYEDERGMRMAEHIWQEQGSPCDHGSLLRVLEVILQRLPAEGIYYPKVILLRKKQMQRGQWTPRTIAGGSTTKVGNIDGVQCDLCGGTGLRNTSYNSGAYCECAAGKALMFPHGIPKPQ
jgi:hypothetical protein